MLFNTAKKIELEYQQIELKVPAYFKALWGGLAKICDNGNLVKINIGLVMVVTKGEKFYQNNIDEVLSWRPILEDEFMKAYESSLAAIEQHIKKQVA